MKSAEKKLRNAGLFNYSNQSLSAFRYCMEIEDDKEVRGLITESFYAYLYCLNLKDRKEVRDRITESYYAYLYCKNIKDRKKMRDIAFSRSK